MVAQNCISRRGRPPVPVGVRFWKKVNKHGPIHPILGTRCWLWTAGTFKSGYGNIFSGGQFGKPTRAHRVSWVLHNGKIPKGLCVLHKCDIPLCVNPKHLFLGTFAINNQDCINKNRRNAPSGELHHYAKLTSFKVIQIRKLYSSGGETLKSLSRKFGVCCSAIHNIITFRRWKFVGTE